MGRKLDRADEDALNACAGYLAKMGQVFTVISFAFGDFRRRQSAFH